MKLQHPLECGDARGVSHNEAHSRGRCRVPQRHAAVEDSGRPGQERRPQRTFLVEAAEDPSQELRGVPLVTVDRLVGA